MVCISLVIVYQRKTKTVRTETKEREGKGRRTVIMRIYRAANLSAVNLGVYDHLVPTCKLDVRSQTG